jgi:signal transduction histidine kinase
VSVLLAKTLRSTTFRLALISIGVFGAVMVALLGYVYWSTATFVLSRYDRAIDAERAVFRSVYDGAGRDGLVRALQQHDGSGTAGDIYLLADKAFVPIAGNLKEWPAGLRGTGGWTEFRAAAPHPKTPDGQSLFRARWEMLSDGSHLLVGQDIGDLDGFADEIGVAFGAAIAFFFTLAGVASVIISRRTVGRIESINMISRAIMDSGLGKRIPLRRGTRDEWDHLAENLNSMLERIESLMGEVKQVGDNVAHDLRTPLTRMRGRLEKASIGQRSPSQDQSLIDGTISDLDDVLRMFSSLTRISQIETASRTAAFRVVNLLEIATEVAELFDAAAEDKGGRVEVAGDKAVFITGDRDLLFDAFANLVDNAVKHGRDGGLVVVAIGLDSGGAVVSVADDGPGIPAVEFQHVFKRFYRLEHSRRTPGNGLGLSLVAAVARLHGAGIALSDNAPGLKVELRFPFAHQMDEAPQAQPVMAEAGEQV